MKLVISLVVLLFQTSNSWAFRMPFILASSPTRNQVPNKQFKEAVVAKEVVSINLDQRCCQGHLRQVVENKIGFLNKFAITRQTFIIAVTIITAFFTRIFSAHAAAASIVMPLAGSEGSIILPLLGMNIKDFSRPFQINPGKLVFFLSALALLGTMATVHQSAGDLPFLLRCFSRRFARYVEDVTTEKSELGLGLPKERGWGEYSNLVIEPLYERKKKTTMKKHRKSASNVLNLFDRFSSKSEVDHTMEKTRLVSATQSFLEQKYKLHHHPVHVSHSRYEVPTYLQSLSVNVLERHDVPTNYLRTLSIAKKSTWDAYQHRLDELNKATSEIDELKQGVSNLHDLMQLEQSMYHASNQVLKLAIDAHQNEMQHVSTHDQLKEFDERLSIQEELKAFDQKAMEYDKIVMNETVAMNKNSILNEEDCKVMNFPV